MWTLKKNMEADRRGRVIEAALQEVERAFTYSSGRDAGWQTDGFAKLSLNRKPLTPGCLTWGKRLHGGGNSLYTGIYYWRRDLGRDIKRVEQHVGGKQELEFIKLLRETLISANDNINRYLKQDPRWSVFLLNRIGHHEWVPEGMTSDTDKLRPEWLGQWKLETEFLDWMPLSVQPEATYATIYKDGGATRITFQTPTAPTAPSHDAVGCQLRYSGGLTYLPGKDLESATSTKTVLGYLRTYSLPTIREVFKPLKPSNRYKQVLVQCPEGEWFDSLRVRFLLLAGDSMIEVMGSGKTVRHFRRVSSSASAPIDYARSAGSSAKPVTYPR